MRRLNAMQDKTQEQTAKEGSTLVSPTEAAELLVMGRKYYDIYRAVKQAMKSGRFDDELRANIDSLERFLLDNETSLEASHEVLYLKIKCLLAEAYDYFGEIGNSDILFKDGA